LTTLLNIFFLSFVFFIPIVLNILGLTKSKYLKILSKVSIGIGTGLMIIATLLLPIFLFIKISILIEINFLVGVIAYIRAKHVKEICIKCEYEGKWNECPAMKPIMDRLYDHKFKKKREYN
jgi:hypothetical protein